MEKAGEVADEEQPGFGVNGDGGDAAMELVVTPDFSGLGDVAGFGGVDATQDPDALPVFRVLADGDVNAVLIENRGGIDFARAFGGRIFEFFSLGRVTIILPNRLEETGVAFFDWFGIEGITKAITAAEHNQLATIDDSKGRRTPLAMEDVRADMRVIFAEEFARFCIQRDEAGRVGRWNIGVRPILAVGSADIDDAIHDE